MSSSAALSAAFAAASRPAEVTAAWRRIADAAGADVPREVQPEAAAVLARLLDGSDWAADLLTRHPAWLGAVLDTADLRGPRRRTGLERELQALLGEPPTPAAAFGELRHWRHRAMLRVAARDLGGLGPLAEILQETSDIADVALEAALRLVSAGWHQRAGRPYHRDPDGRWRPTAFAVLGLGKLGGQELNFSSDVDLLCVYAEEGAAFRAAPRGANPAGAGLPNHQYFRRLAEDFIREVAAPTPDGPLYRVDVRLRPEGDAGPLARSLESCEHYYAQAGQTWERLMLLKVRGVAGDAGLAAEFGEMIQPFRYPRSLSERLLEDLAAMKARLEREVVRPGELERDLKRGRGGIREIEFVAQALQVLNGGKNPFLQTPQTLVALAKLAQYGLLPREDANALAAAYIFLRRAEHRLQMAANAQTHTLPAAPAALARLTRAMDFASAEAFHAALAGHTQRVRAVYDRVFGSFSREQREPLPDFTADAEAWRTRLQTHGFRDPAAALPRLREFVAGPGYVHVSARTSELAMSLVPRLLARCPGALRPPGGVVLSDPDRVLARLDSFIAAYGARAMLYDVWSNNPGLFDLLALLFDRSEFLAEAAIREPDLVDDLHLGGYLQRAKTATDVLADLRHGADDADQTRWLRRYHRTEFMRVGLRDLLGLCDPEATRAELSALAEACLQYGLEVIQRRHRLKQPPFAVIALGKLGGAELAYGSDLDVMFVAPDAACRRLPRLQALAGELLALLSAQTADGAPFETDTRLRPDGTDGLLVNTLGAHAEYYRRRAHLWELQMLTRARCLAGDAAAGAGYAELAAGLTDFRHPRPDLAAWTADWEQEIARMRSRIERERTPAGGAALAFKTGAGGLVDAEFLAQTLALRHGRPARHTLHALEAAAAGGLLPPADAAQLLPAYRELRRLELILRRWSFAGEAELPADAPAQRRVALRCGFRDGPELLDAVARWRADVRAVYARHQPKG